MSSPDSIVIVNEAARGPRGLPGTGAVIYEHSQPTPASTWVVNHNLGRKPPAIQLLTTGGVVFDGSIVHVNDNQFQVLLDSPATGLARVI